MIIAATNEIVEKDLLYILLIYTCSNKLWAYSQIIENDISHN